MLQPGGPHSAFLLKDPRGPCGQQVTSPRSRGSPDPLPVGKPPNSAQENSLPAGQASGSSPHRMYPGTEETWAKPSHHPFWAAGLWDPRPQEASTTSTPLPRATPASRRQWGLRYRVLDSLTLRKLPIRPWVKGIPQGVAQQVERKHHQKDGQTGKDRQPGCAVQIAASSV